MKTITKKLGNQIFVWDPNAYKGKGYWYILGKTGAYGRPASRKEVGQLGRPNEKETIPESPEVYDEPEEDNNVGMSYRQAARIRESGLRNLIAGKIISGGNIGESIKEGISESVKAKLTGLKERLDPLNIARKLTGNLGAAILGKITGRSSEDIEHFTRYGKKRTASPVSSRMNPDKLKKIESATTTKVSSGSTSRLRNKDSLSDVLAKMYNLIKKNFDNEKKQRQIENNFRKQKEKEKDKWNQELIQAITGMKIKGKGSKASLTNKKSKSGELNPNEMSEEGSQLYRLTEGLGEAVASIGSRLGMSTLVKGMGRLFPYAAGITAILAASYGLAKIIEKSILPKPVKGDKDVLDNKTSSMTHNNLAEMYKNNPEGAKRETGKTDDEIKSFLDNPENKEKVFEYKPPGLVKNGAEKKVESETTLKVSSTNPPVAPIVSDSVQTVANNNGASSSADQTNNIIPTTPIVTASLDKNGDGNNNKSSLGQTSPADVKTIIDGSFQTASIQPNVNELNAQFASVNGEYVDNKVISGSSGSTVLADKSKQINIINNNNDGLMVETLVGVREYERSFENTIKQNLRMV